MPNFTFTSDTIVAGQAAAMGSDANAFTFVAQGVTVGSTGNTTIIGTGTGQRVTVAGHVWSSAANAVQLGGADSLLTILAGGAAFNSSVGQTSAVSIFGSRSQLVNEGSIAGARGVYVGPVSGDTQIINHGRIMAQGAGIGPGTPVAGIHLDAPGGSVTSIVNTGTVSGSRNGNDITDHAGRVYAIAFWNLWSSARAEIDNSGTLAGDVVLGQGADRLSNSGTVTGDVQLGGDGDLYQGRGLGVVHGWVMGEGGNDILTGGDLGDRLDSGDGSDTLTGGGGDDTLIGGAGQDRLFGGSGDDHLDGGSGADTLHGGSGEDRLLGGGANDILFGGADADLLDGGVGNDRLNGGAGDDELIGGAGNDTLFGGAGDDTLTGGAGVDRMTGGAGADVFAFLAASDSPFAGTPDRIVDFTPSEDRIDLSALGGNLTFLGTGALSAGTQGVRYNSNAQGHAVLLVDSNADGVADLRVLVLNIAALEGSDFIF